MFIGKPDTEENRATFVSTIPLGRGSTPVDVANACCYLASDEAKFITGVDLQVRNIFLLFSTSYPSSIFRSLASHEIGNHELIQYLGRWGSMCVTRGRFSKYTRGEEENPECVHPKEYDCLMAKAPEACIIHA